MSCRYKERTMALDKFVISLYSYKFTLCQVTTDRKDRQADLKNYSIKLEYCKIHYPLREH